MSTSVAVVSAATDQKSPRYSTACFPPRGYKMDYMALISFQASRRADGVWHMEQFGILYYLAIWCAPCLPGGTTSCLSVQV